MKYELRKGHLPNPSQRGSALLTAIIFSFVVVTLMGSYLYLSSTEYRNSTRSFLLGASFNLAEGGIDRALHVLYEDDHSDWRTGVDGSSNNYWAKRLGPYNLGANIEGYINVVILNPESMSPEIYSEGEAIGHVSGTLKKQLYAGLSSGFFPFLNGFNSKQGVVLKGNNVKFDSYDSRVGNYGLSNVNSGVTVSTISVESDAIDVGNADIYGFVATGGAEPDVGPKGSITTYDDPGKVDPTRITTDFYAEFPSVTAPSLVAPSKSIPSSGTITGGDYDLSSWTVGNGETLRINGDTRIVVSGSIQVKGYIEVASGASLEIYVKGDVNITGNGILNASQVPEQLLVFGMNETAGDQDITIAGNGYLAASVYAPNAVVSMNGGGHSGRIYGAVVGYDAKLVGNSHFSYDEALKAFNLGGGGYQVDEWVELSGVRTAARMDMGDYGF